MLAGLVLVVALGWLFFLLGSALGVSIADVRDTTSVGKGFGIAAVIWVVLNALVSFFLGAMLAGRAVAT